MQYKAVEPFKNHNVRATAVVGRFIYFIEGMLAEIGENDVSEDYVRFTNATTQVHSGTRDITNPPMLRTDTTLPRTSLVSLCMFT